MSAEKVACGDLRLILGDGVRTAASRSWAGLLRAPKPVDAWRAFEMAMDHFRPRSCAEWMNACLPADAKAPVKAGGELCVRYALAQGTKRPAPGKFGTWLALLTLGSGAPMGLAAAEMWERLRQMDRLVTCELYDAWEKAEVPENARIERMIGMAGREFSWPKESELLFVPAVVTCDPGAATGRGRSCA